MPCIDLIEETFLAVRPALVAERVATARFAAVLWPGLSVSVTADRGPAGVRWAVTGSLNGSAEIWLEPFADGVIAHVYLRADPGPARPARDRALARRWSRRVRKTMWMLKDELEDGREPGTDATGTGRRTDDRRRG